MKDYFDLVPEEDDADSDPGELAAFSEPEDELDSEDDPVDSGLVSLVLPVLLEPSLADVPLLFEPPDSLVEEYRSLYQPPPLR